MHVFFWGLHLDLTSYNTCINAAGTWVKGWVGGRWMDARLETGKLTSCKGFWQTEPRTTEILRDWSWFHVLWNLGCSGAEDWQHAQQLLFSMDTLSAQRDPISCFTTAVWEGCGSLGIPQLPRVSSSAWNDYIHMVAFINIIRIYPDLMRELLQQMYRHMSHITKIIYIYT